MNITTILDIRNEWEDRLILAGYDIPAICDPAVSTETEKVERVRTWKAAFTAALIAYSRRMAESARIANARGDGELFEDVVTTGFNAARAAEAIHTAWTAQ